MKKIFLAIKKCLHLNVDMRKMDKRKLEQRLRDQGYSRSRAKRLVSDMKPEEINP